jgi:hypothetical protein
MRAHPIAMRHADPWCWGASIGITWLAEASRAEARAHCLQLYTDGDHSVCVVGYQLEPTTNMTALLARVAFRCWLFENARAMNRVPPHVGAFLTTARPFIDEAIHARCGITHVVRDALTLGCPDAWPYLAIGHALAKQPWRVDPVTVLQARNELGRTAFPGWRLPPLG